MNYLQNLTERDTRAGSMWGINFDEGLIWWIGAPGELQLRFASLAELQAIYAREFGPRFATGRYEDEATAAIVEPLAELEPFLAELRAQGYDWSETEALRPPGDAAERGLAELLDLIRRELNRCLGPAPRRVDQLVINLDEYRVGPAYLDPPALVGLAGPERSALLDSGGPELWYTGERLDFALALAGLTGVLGDHEDQDWPEASEYGPSGLVGAMFDLALVRLAANPRLRANVEVAPSFAAFAVFTEETYVLPERRALARRHIEGHASDYLKACAEADF